MLILISDANVIIDLEEGGLLHLLPLLPHLFKIPDILFYEELEEHHADLLTKGFVLGELSPHTIAYAQTLAHKVVGPSRNDCFALALAKQEKCSLLTGDKALRELATSEGIAVKGTIWLVEELIINRVITGAKAEMAYNVMENAGRRLPWDIARKRLYALKL